ncbi:MAG: S9 family peptidase [Saprospiraceae bacterium]|nr:S9 family peptidase [Saprospiraceae bacterium]
MESKLYSKQDLNQPKAEKIRKETEIHGRTLVDNYYWLNDRENSKVIDYLKAENEYTSQKMKHLDGFKENLFAEIKGRIKEQDESVPYKDNGYFYITKYEEGLEYPIHTRKKESLEAAEDLLLNVNELAKDKSYYSAAGLSVSPNNKILAFGEDVVSRRIYTIRFKNLETGEWIEDKIPNTTGKAIWANDNKTVFYSVKDETLRSYKIFKHRLGESVEKDEEVFHEKDETFNTYVYKTKSEKFIVIASFQTVSSEYQVLHADNPDGDFRILQPRERKLEYDIAHYEDKFYIRTNLDAQNFRLMVTPEDQGDKTTWTEVIPHRADVLLEDMDIFKDFLVLSERKEGITQLRVIPNEGEEHYISFGEEAYMAYTSINLEFDTPLLRIGYQSLTTPSTTYDYHMQDRSFSLLKQKEVLGGFNKEDYRSERVFATARDGAKVPISIVYHKDFQKDGKHPVLLYGYGSYGASMDPSFGIARLSLLNRGMAFAIAHIRGGEEMGRHWYENGKLLKKKNTFYDFIDCGKFLVEQQYAASDQLYAMGGSAGGLLMGAVMNLEPDMWKGIVAAVPFVDVINTMLDESIPLTTGEFDEWGNPKVEAFFDYIYSYSPYDQVEAKAYPATLVTTGLHDSQVQYWEPAKWVAKLREMKTDHNPLLLHTNMEAGHGGASGRFERIKEIALEYAFLLDLAGKSES